jgi:hypothetical protein
MNALLAANETAAQPTDVFYVLEIHGFAPEFMSGLAFRSVKPKGARRMKTVDCPHCGKPYGKVDAQTRVEFVCKPQFTSAFHQFSRPCKICHNVVGIVFV